MHLVLSGCTVLIVAYASPVWCSTVTGVHEAMRDRETERGAVEAHLRARPLQRYRSLEVFGVLLEATRLVPTCGRGLVSYQLAASLGLSPVSLSTTRQFEPLLSSIALSLSVRQKCT